MKCFTCDKELNLETCARCREVLKIDLVKAVLEMDPIYLSESNRHKTGPKPKLTDAGLLNDIKQAHKNGISIRELADKYKVSVGTIHKIIHKP